MCYTKSRFCCHTCGQRIACARLQLAKITEDNRRLRTVFLVSVWSDLYQLDPASKSSIHICQPAAGLGDAEPAVQFTSLRFLTAYPRLRFDSLCCSAASLLLCSAPCQHFALFISIQLPVVTLVFAAINCRCMTHRAKKLA